MCLLESASANVLCTVIRAAVLEGDIDKALKRTRAVYPKVLDEPLEAYSDLEFKLQCRKFIEMVVRIKDVKASSKRIAPGVESMDVDDGPRSAEDVAAQEHDAKCRALEKEALEYGRKLRDRYGAHEHESVRQHLEDSFALLALHNAAHLGSLGELLDKRKQRGQLAEELNSAILGTLPFPRLPPSPSSSLILARFKFQPSRKVSSNAAQQNPKANRPSPPSSATSPTSASASTSRPKAAAPLRF